MAALDNLEQSELSTPERPSILSGTLKIFLRFGNKRNSRQHFAEASAKGRAGAKRLNISELSSDFSV